jgi:hypothetical protein
MTMHRFLRTLAAVALVAGAAPSRVHAQGVTTGAVSGVVVDNSGQPADNVQIQVVNRATGFSRGALTNASGVYTILGLDVGSTYAVTARRIGYQPQTIDNVVVTLSQTTKVDIKLEQQAAQLEGVTTVAETNALISPSRTGAATTFTDSALRRLPTIDRNFTDFVSLTPQMSNAGPGFSGGGTNNRFNNIQIDGAISSDIFGLGSTGQPGGQAKGKSISIESVKEYQVLLSPYDVRQGNFSGALINAVTKSGTNEFHGSAYGVMRNKDLTRSQPFINDFTHRQYGFTLGGPIVKDKIMFFVNPEIQRRETPANGPYIGSPQTTITQDLVDRFNAAMQSYGLPAGSGAPVTNQNPLTNVFARLDFFLPYNTSLVLRHNYAQAQDDIFSRSTANFYLDNNGYAFTSKTHSTAAQLRTNFASGIYNEMLLSVNSTRDRRRPNVLLPQVEAIGVGTTWIVGGGERSSHRNELDQDVLELTDNVTIPVGQNHRITVGTQNQFYKARNLFLQNGFGRWIFGSLDSLEMGLPRQYLVGVPVSGDGAVRFHARQHALYAQDQWSVTPTFNLTYGLRLDVPIFDDKPPTNPAVARPLCATRNADPALCGFGRNTADVPSGNLQWSPRVGFNWDVTGDAQNQLRGGIGMFTGRPAYVWLANAFQYSGYSGVAQLTCTRAQTTPNRAPTFTADRAAHPPAECGDGLTAAAGGQINLLNPDLKFPQNLRATLGYDRDLGSGFVGTLEAMYTRGISNLFYQNIALAGPIGTGAHGRVIYGAAPGSPSVRVAGRTQMYDVDNQSKDYSYQLTAGIARRWRNNFEGSLFYTYSQVYDVQSLTSSVAQSQYEYGMPVAWDQTEKRLGHSIFEQPHRIVAQGTYSFKTRTDITLTYVGESGNAFTYTVSGDVNGDGSSNNDPIYIPKDVRDPTEMQFRDFTRPGTSTVVTVAEQQDAFDKLVSSMACLNKHRGEFAPRNVCHAPWSNMVNLSVRQSLKTIGMQNMMLQVDVFNFGNLLNKRWGQYKQVNGSSSFGSQSLLKYETKTAGSFAEGAVPIYSFDPNFKSFTTDNIRSNYQIQMQVKYSF